MPRALVRASALAALAASAALAGCNTAKPAPQFVGRMTMVVQADPETVMSRLRADAQSQGGAIVADSADTFAVDYGVQTRRIPVPTEYGLWGTRVSYRNTEVHESATYGVWATDGGTLVSITHNPIYWHPDIKCWLPGPHDMVPGLETLRGMSGTR